MQNMEWLLALLMIAVPLTGFQPDRSKDGWTMYRDRVFVCLSIVFRVFLLLNYTAFGLIFLSVFQHYEGYESLASLALWTVIFAMWLLFQQLSNAQMEIVIVGIVLAGVVQSILAMVDFVNLKIGKNGRVPVCGSLGNKTYLAAYLTIIAPLVANPKTWHVFLILSVGILITGTRIYPIVYLICTALVWPKAALAILPIFLLVLIKNFRDLPSITKDSMPIRGNVWRLTFERGKEHWFMGRGYNSFSKSSFKWSGLYDLKEVFVHAHNDYLQLFYEYGLVGIAALIIFAIPIVRNMHAGSGLTGSVVAIALCALFSFPTHIAPIGVTILFLLSALHRGLM